MSERRLIKFSGLLVGLSYLALRIVQWVLSLPTINGADSHSYLPGTGLAVPENWYFGFEKVSFSGDGAIRPWTVTLPYALLGTDYIRSFSQMLLSAFAFFLLAIAIKRATKPFWLGVSLGSLVIAFSLTTAVASWDMLLQRESITLSLTALLAGLCLTQIHRPGRVTLVLCYLFSLLLCVTRPTLFPVVFLALIVIALAEFQRERRDAGGGSAAGYSRLVIMLSGIVLILGYAGWMSQNLDRSWDKWYGQTMSETQFGYVMSDYNPRIGSIVSELTEEDAPACLIDSLPVSTETYMGAPWGFAASLKDSCPNFEEWFQNQWPGWYYSYLLGHPEYIGKLLQTGIPLALSPWDGTSAVSVLPGSVRDVFLPSFYNTNSTSEYDPNWGYWALVIAMIFAVTITFPRRFACWLSQRRRFIALAVAAVTGSIASIAINLLLVPSFIEENYRVSFAPSLLLRLAGILLMVFAIWRLAEIGMHSIRNRMALDAATTIAAEIKSEQIESAESK